MVGVVADRVIVELEAKLDRYNANVISAQRTFEKSMGGIGASAKRTEGLVSGAAGRIGGAFALAFTGAVAVGVVKGFLGYADAAKQLNAQLKLATAASGDFGTAQKAVRDIAAATRSGLNETGALYANIARNARELGLTQTQVAEVTTSVSQAFLISGASAQEAAQGTRQLIQGLQSGTLRGDEFNSVMENAPRLARLLADSLNVPIGSLRAMAEAGDLTAAKLTSALSDKEFTAALDAEFKQLPVTFDQAMTLVQNAAQETFSAFDAGGQFSQSLANFVTNGADGFGDLAAAAEQLGIDIASAMAGLSDAFQPMIDGALSAFNIIGGNARSLGQSIADVLNDVDEIANIGIGGVNFFRKLDSFGAGAGPYKPFAKSNLGGRFSAGLNRREGQLDNDRRERNVQKLPGAGNSFQRFLNEPGKFDAFGNPLTPFRPTAAAGKAKKGPKGRKGPSAETLAARAERAALQQEREDEAFRQDLARTNEDILAAKAALSVAADAIAAYEIQEIDSTRKRINAGYDADVKQGKLREAQAESLKLANDELAGLKTKAIQLKETERVRAESVQVAQADRQNDLDLLQAGEQLADTREEQRDVALRILDAQYAIERAELEGVIASRDATAAQKAIAERRLAILGQLQAGDKAAVEQGSKGPMDSYLSGLNSESINDQLEQVQVDGIRGVTDELANATASVFKFGGAFGEVANQIIADLARIAIQAAILAIGKSIFGAGFGAPSIPGRASGGHVQGGKSYRVNEGANAGRVEGFQPAGSGKIIPLGRMNQANQGGVTVVQSFTLDARGGITTPELLRHVNQVATRKAAQAGNAAYDAAQRSAPGRIDKFSKLGT